MIFLFKNGWEIGWENFRKSVGIFFKRVEKIRIEILSNISVSIIDSKNARERNEVILKTTNKHIPVVWIKIHM